MAKPVLPLASSEVTNVAAPPAEAITVKCQEMHECSGRSKLTKRAISRKATSEGKSPRTINPEENQNPNSKVKTASTVENSDKPGTTSSTRRTDFPTLEEYTSPVRQYHNRVGKSAGGGDDGTSRMLCSEVAASSTLMFNFLYSVDGSTVLMQRENTRTLEAFSALLEGQLHVPARSTKPNRTTQSDANTFGVLLEADA
ncbi:hypothetical protein S40293_11229 [Stachybotrys chartarum IBT 40293]|nr:hypothetical protein S40293_11229 [Stachybotrys chartarum IBT 40293]